jgi:hypothetical protein
MALPINIQNISLAGGMNEKTPREMLPPDQLELVKNGRWITPGKVETRLGYATLATSLVGSGTLPTASHDRLLVRDDELCRLNERGLYSYQTEVAKWIRRDDVPEAHLYANRILSVFGDDLRNGDMAIASNGLQCVAFTRLSSIAAEAGLYAIIASPDGRLVLRSRLAADASKPRVVAVGNIFVVAYASATDANTIYAHTIGATDPAAFTSASAIVTDLQGTGNLAWDMASTSTYFVLAYQSNAFDVTVRRFDTSLTNTHSDTQTSPTVGGQVAIYVDGTNVMVAYADTALVTTQIGRWSPTLVFDYIAVAIAAATGTFLTIGPDSNASNVWIARTGSQGCEVRAFAKSTGAAVSGATRLTQNVEIASKIFSPILGAGAGDAFICVRVAVGEDEQEGLVCCALGSLSTSSSHRLRPIAKWLTGKVSWSATDNHLPQAAALSNSFYATHIEKEFSLQGRGAHVVVARLDMNAGNRWARIEDRDTALVAAGMLHQYDGDQLTEIPYAWYPWFTTSVTAEATNPLPAGTYEYTVVYEWTDARGRIHRSIPALTQTQVVAANQKAVLTIRNLTVTSRSDVAGTYRTPVFLAVYRRGPGAGAADPFVRLAAVGGGTYPEGALPMNDPLNATQVVTDSGTGGASGERWTTVNQPQLYTTGGVLEASPPSSCRVLTKWDNRIWLGGCENANSIWYSRELVEGEPPYFHENQQVLCEEKVTALANFDSALIVFAENAIWVMQGNGPNDRGEGSTYTGLVKLPSEVGCKDWRSVCVTEEGVFFQHRPGEGIYLLDRSLSLLYIGAAIENHATVLYPTVTSAVAVPSEDEVRFSVTNGTTGRLLVYNTLIKQWMTHQLYSSLELDPRDAVMWQDAYVWVKSDRVAWQSASYQDYDTAAVSAHLIALEIRTGDIALAGPLGVERTWRCLLLGRRHSGQHGLEVKIAYDQSDTFTDTKTWTFQEVDAWTSLPNESFEVVAHSRQEARSIRLSIKTLIGATAPQSVGLMALALEHAQEQKLAALPAEQRR